MIGWRGRPDHWVAFYDTLVPACPAPNVLLQVVYTKKRALFLFAHACARTRVCVCAYCSYNNTAPGKVSMATVGAGILDITALYDS